MPTKIFKKFKSLLRRPKRYWQIFFLIIYQKPKKIMEIGIWTGDRALTMIGLAKRFHKASEIEYYGFDLFGEMTSGQFDQEKSKWPPSQQEAHDKLIGTGVNIHLFQGDTTIVLPEAVGRLPKMDLIFIDGGHSLETIANDWNWASQLMGEKTRVIFDDYWLDRTDAGCKVTVDDIDRDKYTVNLWPMLDTFNKTNFGPLRIKLASVQKK